MHKQLHILFILLVVSSLFTTVYADENIDNNNTKFDEIEVNEESVSEELIKYEEITEDELNEFLQEFYVALNNKNNIKMKELLDKPLDIQEFDNTGNLVDYTILEKRKGDKNDYFIKTTLYFKDTQGNLYESSQYIYVYKENDKIKISFDKFYENVTNYPDFLEKEQIIFNVISKVKALKWSEINVQLNNGPYEKKYTDEQIKEMIETTDGVEKLKEDSFYYQLLIIYSNYYYGPVKTNVQNQSILGKDYRVQIFIGKESKNIETEYLVDKNIQNYYFSDKIIPLTYNGISIIKDNKTNESFLPIYDDNLGKTTSEDDDVIGGEESLLLILVPIGILGFIGLMWLIATASTPTEMNSSSTSSTPRRTEPEPTNSVISNVYDMESSVNSIIQNNNQSTTTTPPKEQVKVAPVQKLEVETDRKIIYDKKEPKKEENKEIQIESKRKINFDE